MIIPKAYLRGAGGNGCRYSPELAQHILDSCNNGAFAHAKPGVVELTASDMRTILDAYANRRIVYTPDDFAPKGQVAKANQIIASAAEKLEEIVYSSDETILKFPGLGDNSVSAISEMDFEALLKEIPFGEISPALPATMFKSSALRIPTPTGFVYNLGIGHFKSSPWTDASCIQGEEGKYKISVPNISGSTLWVPMSGEVIYTSQNVKKIARPTDFDPLIWRARKPNDGISYSINQTAKDSPLLKANPNVFLVSEEEQKYWRLVFPLPRELEEKLEDAKQIGDADRIVDLLASWLAVKDKETKLANFRYACHPRLGKFYRENADDLPLLIHELRAGHCDLLSWYFCAMLRSYGQVAWVSTNKLTTKDGEHFNNAYLHSTVTILKPDGSLVEFDPTKYVDFDKAYHPKIMSDDLIDKLEERFLEAETRQEKAQIIREFNKGLVELRKHAEVNRDVSSSMREIISSGALAFLSGPESEFDNSIATQNACIVSWDRLPEEVTPESVCRVISLLDLSEVGYHTDVFLDYNLKAVSIRSKQYEWLLKALNKMQSSAFYTTYDSVSEELFSADNDILSSDIVVHSTLNHQVPGLMIEQVKLCDLLSRLKSYLKSTLLSGKDELTGQGSHLSISSLNVLSLKDFDISLLNTHKYSRRFKNYLKSGLFPTYQKENTVYLAQITDFCQKDQEMVEKGLGNLLWDLIIFSFEYQLACRDAKYRKPLLDKLEISEEKFKNLSNMFLKHDRKVKKIELPYVSRENDEAKRVLDESNRILYLNGRDRVNFERATKRVLSAMDKNPARGKVIEFDERREYTFGDDMRNIDWNAFARFDKFYVKASPVPVKDVSTPLHVDIELDYTISGPPFENNFVYFLQLQELIRILQEEVKSKRRDVYVSVDGGNYIKLPHNVRPADFIASAANTEDKKASPILKNGSVPRNMLFVSDSYNNISAMRYLYGRHCNFGHILLHEKPFRVFPLVKPEWVEGKPVKPKRRQNVPSMGCVNFSE